MKLESEFHEEMLLSEPGEFPPASKIERPSLEVTVEEKFDSRKLPRQFSRQYAHSYSLRLWKVRPRLEEIVKTEWPDVPIKKIAELCEFSHSSAAPDSKDSEKKVKTENTRNSGDHGQHIAFREDIVVAVIGTIFKYQPEKPSILQDIAEENPMIPVVPKTKFTSDKDTIQLEDETTRVQLIPAANCGMSVGSVVNGVICAVKGRPNINGKFEVSDVIFPTPDPAAPLKTKLSGEMIFVSGLDFGSKADCLNFRAEILFDLLEGLVGCPVEYGPYASKRTQVFFVGNTLTKFVEDDKGKSVANKTEIMQRADKMFDDLARTMDVFILPGENDPSEPTLPQFPIHRCVLPNSSRRQTFTALTNPARIKVPMEDKSEGLDVLLTSGQNVKDAMRNSETTSAIEMAHTLLRWGHLCPTAPDTLPLHPGTPDDVFVLDTLPHVFAVGNQSSFEAREWQNTKIFTVPKFSETGCVVILNQDLEVVPLMISVK